MHQQNQTTQPVIKKQNQNPSTFWPIWGHIFQSISFSPFFTKQMSEREIDFLVKVISYYIIWETENSQSRFKQVSSPVSFHNT